MRDVRVRVAVVGAGPGGLAAVRVLGRDLTPSGPPLHAWRGGRADDQEATLSADIALLDDAPIPGGQIWRAGPDGPADDVHPYLAALRHHADRVAVLPETQVVDCLRCPGVAPILLATSPAGPVRIEVDSIVLATGAMERFLPFPGWTLPGVVGAGGLQALIKGGLDVDGRRIVIAGSGPLLLAVADLARRRGAHVVAVAEQASRRALWSFARAVLGRPAKLLQALGFGLRLAGVAKAYGTWPVRAEGDGALERVVLRSAGGRERSLDCDLLACGFGLVPRVALPRLLGCQVEPCGEGGDGTLRVAVDDRQATSVPGVYAVGECTGVGGVDKALAEGRVAGFAAAGREPPAPSLDAVRSERRFANVLASSFALRDELRDLPADDTLVCRCEDVPWGAVRGAASSRDAKLRSRCGMGPCQARVCGPALAFLAGWAPESPRPPLFPTDLETLSRLYGDEYG